MLSNIPFSGSFMFLSIEAEPINCNFIFLQILLIDSLKIRVDEQNNAWVIFRYR